MKKSILQFSVIAAIAASMTLTTSCSSDDSAEEAFVPTPIQLGVDLGKMTVTRGLTRAQANNAVTNATTIDGDWKTGHNIGVWTTDADAGTKIKVYKVSSDATTTATIEPVSTAADGVFYWKAKNEKKIIKAVSHGKVLDAGIVANASATTIAPLDFTVSTDQTEDVNNEFLYSVGTIKHDGTTTGGSKTILMQHQLTRLNVIIKAKKTVTDLALTIGNSTTPIITSGTFVEPSYSEAANEDLNATHYGTWNTTSGSTGIVSPRCISAQTSDTPSGYTTTFSAVVIPQTFVSKPMFCIKYDGADYIYTGVAADNLADYNESASGVNGVGKEITYTITITDQDIDVTQATISAWSTGTPKSGNAELQ